jgi:hypothetical protein
MEIFQVMYGRCVGTFTGRALLDTFVLVVQMGHLRALLEHIPTMPQNLAQRALLVPTIQVLHSRVVLFYAPLVNFPLYRVHNPVQSAIFAWQVRILLERVSQSALNVLQVHTPQCLDSHH